MYQFHKRKFQNFSYRLPLQPDILIYFKRTKQGNFLPRFISSGYVSRFDDGMTKDKRDKLSSYGDQVSQIIFKSHYAQIIDQAWSISNSNIVFTRTGVNILYH